MSNKKKQYPQVVDFRDNRKEEIRLIVDENNIGMKSISEALKIAEEKNLDLVEVSQNVCKVIDFGSYLYHQKKKNKQKQKKNDTKEIKLKPHISDHDLETKVRHALGFLEKGNKVKISVFFKGRDIQHKDIGEKLLDKVLGMVKEHCKIEHEPKHEGNSLNTMLTP